METSIQVPNFKSYRNSEYQTFHNGVRTMIEASGASTLGVNELFVKYAAAIDRFEQIIVLTAGSVLTAAVEKADELRDRRYSAFVMYVRAFLYDESPALFKAADNIMFVIKATGNPTELGYNSETAVIKNLNEKLSSLMVDLNTLDAKSRLDALVDANNEFDALQIQRYNEEGGKMQKPIRDCREEIDSIYKQIRERINAQIIVSGYATYKQFVEGHNEEIKKYRELIAQRKGRTIAKKAPSAE